MSISFGRILLILWAIAVLPNASAGREPTGSSILPNRAIFPFVVPCSLNGGDQNNAVETEESEEEVDDEEPEEIEPLETERDAFTNRTRTLERGTWVAEFSYTFTDTGMAGNKHSYPEYLGRYGLTDHIELRIGWNQERGGKATPSTGLEDEGDAPSGSFVGGGEQSLLYGVKFLMSRETRFVPESSLILQGYTPTGGERNDSKFLLGYVFGWNLLNGCKLDAELRLLTDSEEQDHFLTWIPSVVLRMPLSCQTTTHIEYFAFSAQQKEENFNRQFLSGGVAHNPVPNVEIGARCGVGLNRQAADFFANIGLGIQY